MRYGKGIADYIRAVRPWRIVVWLLGIALLFIGGGWPLSDVGGIGCVLIAISVLQWPWGASGYRRRCARAAANAAKAIENNVTSTCKMRQRNIETLRALEAPAGFDQEKQALIALLENAETLRCDCSTPLPERSVELMNLRLRSDAMYTKLVAHARTETERSYCEALNSIMVASNRMVDSEARETAHILGGLIGEMERFKPPTLLQTTHSGTCQAFRDELVALSAYEDAARGSDTDAVRVAATRYQDAARACYAKLNELGVRTASPLPRRAA
jgi:hypothetical protein